jgi:hypothetical protein
MSTPSFIKRFLSMGKGEDESDDGGAQLRTDTIAATGEAHSPAAGETAIRPSITEILFRRRGAEGEDEEAGSTALVPDTTAERQLSRREETAQKLTEGLDSMSSLLKGINEKLSAGNERSRALVDSIEDLPEVLRSIPETNRAQIEFLGTISRQLDVQSVRTSEMMDQFQAIPRLQREQTEKLGEIAERLSDTSAAQRQHLEGVQQAQQANLQVFQSAQNKSLNLFHKAQQQSLAMLKGAQDMQARQLEQLVASTQQTMNRVMITCVVVVSVVIAGAAAAFLLT